MAVSKNNPAVRDNQRLLVRCPQCDGEMALVKRVPGGMFYACPKEHYHPVSRGSYKDMPHQWVRK